MSSYISRVEQGVIVIGSAAFGALHFISHKRYRFAGQCNI